MNCVVILMSEDFRCKGTYRHSPCRRLLFVSNNLKMTGDLSTVCPRCGCRNTVKDGKLELSENQVEKTEKPVIIGGN